MQLRFRNAWLASLALSALFLRGSGNAETSAASDIDIDLSGVSVSDEEIAIDDAMGGIVIEGLGGLPQAVAVDAYHDLGNGERLFSIDGAAALGAAAVGPEDVVRYDGFDYSIEFDGSAEGLPAGANLDAVTLDGSDLVLSFDITVTLDGNTYSDEDLVSFDGVNFGSKLDASAAGFDATLDLDAAHHLGAGVYALSFDGHGTHGGIAFADEDVVSFDPGGPTTSLIFDASGAHAGWASADLQALPEPGSVTGLLCGFALLAALQSRRRWAASARGRTCSGREGAV